MRTPISKLLPKEIVPNSEKVTTCCGIDKFIVSNDRKRIYCVNPKCEKSKPIKKEPQETTLVNKSGDVTSYIIRPLNTIERGVLTDISMSLKAGDPDAPTPNEVIKKWVQAGLTAWKNFDLQFKTEKKKIADGLDEMDVITDSCYKELPYADVLEIASAVQLYHELDGEVEKN